MDRLFDEVHHLGRDLWGVVAMEERLDEDVRNVKCEPSRHLFVFEVIEDAGGGETVDARETASRSWGE